MQIATGLRGEMPRRSGWGRIRRAESRRELECCDSERWGENGGADTVGILDLLRDIGSSWT